MNYKMNLQKKSPATLATQNRDIRMLGGLKKTFIRKVFNESSIVLFVLMNCQISTVLSQDHASPPLSDQ